MCICICICICIGGKGHTWPAGARWSFVQLNVQSSGPYLGEMVMVKVIGDWGGGGGGCRSGMVLAGRVAHQAVDCGLWAWVRVKARVMGDGDG